jgi:hypothetical protein
MMISLFSWVLIATLTPTEGVFDGQPPRTLTVHGDPAPFSRDECLFFLGRRFEAHTLAGWEVIAEKSDLDVPIAWLWSPDGKYELSLECADE